MDRVLDLAEARRAQADLVAQAMNRAGQAGVACEGVTFRPYHAQRQEPAVIASQSGQQSRSQKR
nr:hypothetical protein [Mycolicibacterium porcinum]